MAWFDQFSANPFGDKPLDMTGGLLPGNESGNPAPISGGFGSPAGSNTSFNATSLPGTSPTPIGSYGGGFSQPSSGASGSNANWLTSLGASGAGAAVAGGALAFNLFKGDQTDPNITSLHNLVESLGPEQSQLFAQGNQYMSYLAAGTLPPGMQEQLREAKAAGKARFLQNAASSGLSADPNKNSALAQDLNSLDAQEKAAQAQQAQQLLSAGNSMISQGIQISNLDANIFKYLSDYDLKQSQATGSAITNFASALGSFAGAAGGFAIGGPVGASVGAGLGGAAGKAGGSLLG